MICNSEGRVEKSYLLIPIKNGAPKSQIQLRIKGEVIREFYAELADTQIDISFHSFLDVNQFRGQTFSVHIKGSMKNLISQADEIPGSFYKESLRPQFHFSAKVGWVNDPNGLVYHEEEWHLYFQHNPYGIKWGNMHWGHAVSPDLVHWHQEPIAIYNKNINDWAFSGSAVVDMANTGGWGEGAIIAAWTSTGRGECIAYSLDRGRTFTEFSGNPVVRHERNGRDPKLLCLPLGSIGLWLYMSRYRMEFTQYLSLLPLI